MVNVVHARKENLAELTPSIVKPINAKDKGFHLIF